MMNKCRAILGIALMACFTARGEGPSKASVEPQLPTMEAVLTPISISEDRQKDLTVEGADPHRHRKLTLTARLEGVEFKETRGWGHVVISKAWDDTGGDLRNDWTKANPTTKPADRLATPRADDEGDDQEDVFDTFEVIEPPAGSVDQDVLIDFELARPERKATKIVSLKGYFVVLRGGTIKEISLPHLLDAIDKPIENEGLKEANVEIALSKDKRNDKSIDPSSLVVTIKGKPIAIVKMEVLDDAGVKMNNAGAYGMPAMTATWARRNYGLDRPLDNQMVLKIHVMVGQTAVRVPFDFKDIPLP